LSRNWTPIADRKRRTAGRKVVQGSPTSRLLLLSTAKSGEQSENVYENKGRGQKVERSSAVSGIDPPLTRLATLATLSARESADDDVRSQYTKIVGTNLQKSLKTKEGECYKVRKRTQNEANFEHKMRESSPDSEVARSVGKKPLTRLATLATLSPGKRAAGRGLVGNATQCEKTQKLGEQSQEVIENK